jgi:hypothetical protein
MSKHQLLLHPVRTLDLPKIAAGAVVTLALLFGTVHVASAAYSNFALLANAGVTSTGGSISGDVGTFLAKPTGAVTLTGCPIMGMVHVGDGTAKMAFNDFTRMYATLAPKLGDVSKELTGTLAGVSLPPGVYSFSSAATLTGVLTLKGPSNGTWVFKVGTGGTGALTGTNFSVVMADGAQASNVTWWVAQAVTLTDSNFMGNILSGAGITLTRGTFAGSASSKADVTTTGTAVTR